MERSDRLKFCKICKEKKFNEKTGIVCGLTNMPADFEVQCASFSEDAMLKAKYEQEEKTRDTPTNLANTGKRFANYLLDRIFALVFVFIFGAAYGLLCLIFSPETLFVEEEGVSIVDYLIAFIAMFCYYALFEGLTGRTPSKYITKTKVVNEQGEMPDFGTIVVRTLCRFVPFEAFSFLGEEGKGWHDQWSKTFVVGI